MRKYGGELIHSARDEAGLVEVVEAHGIRSLHFGNGDRQSALCLSDPERLELPYLRSMLAGLLFAEPPGRVLVLGLGGGSLAGFLLRQFPDCRVDAVEARALVAVIAHGFFGLPEDPRLNIAIGDGAEFLRREADACRGAYDHIFVDLFDRDGLAAAVSETGFFAAARALLGDAGILAVNLWRTRPDSLRETLAALRRYCEGGVRRLDVMGRGNVIGFGLGPDVPDLPRRVLDQRAERLEHRLGIEFTRFQPLLSAPR